MDILKLLSKYLFLLALFMVIPFGFALYCEFWADPLPHSTVAFAWSIGISLGLAAVLRYFGRNASGQLYRRRDGIILVVLIWVVTSLVSALPFYFSRTLGPLNAYFEAMSGLTTT